MVESRFHIDAIPPSRLAAMRRAGVDDGGNAVGPPLEARGEPLRCCLRLAGPGERLILIAYRPFERPGPYAEVGPVYVHERACDGYSAHGVYPEAFRDRQQVLRCYDFEGRITGGRLCTPGDSVEEVIAELLSDDKVAQIHTRNVVFGCYMLQVRRSSDSK